MNNPLKILHLLPSLHIGGTEKIVFEVCRGIDPGRYAHHVVALKYGGYTEQLLRQSGVPVTLLHSPDGFLGGMLDFFRLRCELKRLIRDVNPDILHTWLARANALGRLLSCSKTALPVLSTLHVMETEKHYHLWSERWLQPRSRYITVNSAALKTFAARKIGIPTGKLVLIRNGIEIPDPCAVQTKSLQARQRWARAGEFVIGAMGRLHRQKGFDLLLRAAQRVTGQFANTRFLIAGEGPEKEALIRLASELEIGDRITFCGWVTPALDFIAGLDVFVLSSRWEGMSNVVMEAMSAGKPVVVTDVSGMNEVIRSGQEGLIVPAEDPQACVDALTRLILDDGLRRTISESAVRRIKNDFSMEKMLILHANLYEKVLQEPRAS